MSGSASAPPAATAATRSRHELLVTILLVVAAVATSWSSYQATRWHGAQATATSQTSAIRIEASRAASLAAAQTQVDVATFIAWADADQSGDTARGEFFINRFRPEFRTAFDAWIAMDPITTPGAPPTPFAMDEYQVESLTTAQQLDIDAEDSAAQVQRYIQDASNYVLTVVLYAVVLFFAGVSTKIARRRLRSTLITAGYLVFAGTLVWVATFPVSVAV